jgi:hypothetical protein
MALCFELESCYPDINPSIFTSTNLGQFLGKYISICGACYLVKPGQSTNCTDSVEIPATFYDDCATCYNITSQSICGACPEFYELVTLEDGTEVCQAQSSYPAEWSGELAAIDPGNRSGSYGILGLNLLENATNAVWPIVGYKTENFPSQQSLGCSPPTLNPSCDGAGFWSNWGFKDDWGNGNYIFGQVGYSVFDTFIPTPTQAKTSAVDLNALFRSSNTSTRGRLNTAGIWGFDSEGTRLSCSIGDELPTPNAGLQYFIEGNSLTCDNTSVTTSYIRYDFCFSVGVEKEYLVGFAADNAVRIILDDQPFLVLTSQIGSDRCGFDNYEPAFNHWHVIPITFTPGVHTITIIGYNNENFANYAAEVYNLTSQELKDQFLNITLPSYAATVAAFEPYILFSTKNYIGNNSYTPVGEGEWTCLDGSTADPCSQSGQPQCGCISNIPATTCCYKLTKCGEGTVIYTTTDLSQYQGQIAIVTEFEGCYLVEQTTENCPQGEAPVTVIDTYANCEICLPSYKLFNCKDQNVTLQTASVAFEGYLGKVVNLVEYPGDCWQVGPNDQKTLPLQPLTVDGQPFDTCEECDPKEFGLTNCINGVTVISTLDLSAYVGKVVKADNFPGVCFTVEENPCNCLRITINGQVYNIDREENFFNGRPYFHFNTINNLPIVIAYDSNQLRWEVYNPDTQVVYFYSNLDMDCPTTSFWTKLDPTFPGNITTQVCTLRILNISPTEEFNDCECCVNC